MPSGSQSICLPRLFRKEASDAHHVGALFSFSAPHSFDLRCHIHFLDKVIKLICTPNHEMKNATMVPYSSLSLYNGKSLLALPAVEYQVIPRWRGGTFSEALPDLLKILSEDTEVYRKAIWIINEVSSRVSPCSSVSIISGISACLLGSLHLMIAIFLFAPLGQNSGDSYKTFFGCIVVFATLSTFSAFVNWVYHYKIKSAAEKLVEMSHVAGEGHSLLIKNSLLVGCDS